MSVAASVMSYGTKKRGGKGRVAGGKADEE
jgi:hypothetical protein